MQLTATRMRRLRAATAARVLLAGALCLACLAAAPQPVCAYSSFADYVRPIAEGGGGGRLFTGTPADAYGCEVCHRGAQGAKLNITGLPIDGYVPGQSYEITLQAPEATPHAALIAEFTDTSGLPSGITALAPYVTWQKDERCDNDFPAADLCRASGANSGCCRDLDATRDACSFPGERSVLWLLDCGAKRARVVWTAPTAGAGDVWFSSSMVTSDVKHDVLGDGVTLERKRLRMVGSPVELTTAVGSCQAVPGTSAGSSWAAFVFIQALNMLLVLRSRQRWFTRGVQRHELETHGYR